MIYGCKRPIQVHVKRLTKTLYRFNRKEIELVLHLYNQSWWGTRQLVMDLYRSYILPSPCTEGEGYRTDLCSTCEAPKP